MTCREVSKIFSSALDGQTQKAEIKELEQHLNRCSSCALHSHQTSQLRSALQSMPVRQVPEDLTTRLRVVASQRQVQQERRATFRNESAYWIDVFRVWSGNLMRPLAVPAVGGIVSAIFLFTMLVPIYGVRAVSAGTDVPTVLSTQVTMKQTALSFGVENEGIVVDVFIDEQGRLLDYSVPLGQNWQSDPDVRRCVENALLCTQFTPATMFGMPKSGRLRITFRRNQVEVKG